MKLSPCQKSQASTFLFNFPSLSLSITQAFQPHSLFKFALLVALPG